MSWIYDAHIHLSDPEYKSEIDMILNYMDLLKIKACCVSMDIETSNETMALYEKSKNVLPFIGIHPEMAQKSTEPVYGKFKKMFFQNSYHWQRNLTNLYQFIQERHYLIFLKYCLHTKYLEFYSIGLMETNLN